MTWAEGVATEPAGHDSSRKEGVVVLCDVCRLGTEFVSRGAYQRAGVEGVHRLLMRRGWTADLATGEDACPSCTLEVAS